MPLLQHCVFGVLEDLLQRKKRGSVSRLGQA
jgi:hypothetical protein